MKYVLYVQMWAKMALPWMYHVLKLYKFAMLLLNVKWITVNICFTTKTFEHFRRLASAHRKEQRSLASAQRKLKVSCWVAGGSWRKTDVKPNSLLANVRHSNLGVHTQLWNKKTSKVTPFKSKQRKFNIYYNKQNFNRIIYANVLGWLDVS